MNVDPSYIMPKSDKSSTRFLFQFIYFWFKKDVPADFVGYAFSTYLQAACHSSPQSDILFSEQHSAPIIVKIFRG